jgi:hypothetical protein
VVNGDTYSKKYMLARTGIDTGGEKECVRE